MYVRLFNDIAEDAQQWDAFVAQHEGATSDHMWGWRRVLHEAFDYQPYYLGAFDGDIVRGVLPLFRVPRGWQKCALVSIPFGNYGGICAESPAASEALFLEAKGLLHQLNGEYLDLRHQISLNQTELQAPRWSYLRYTMQLSGNVEDHFQRFGGKNRNQVRLAKKNGLRTEFKRDIDALYRIHLHTARRQGTPCFPRKYFELILQEFGSQVQVLFIMKSDISIAYDVFLKFKTSLVIQLNGSLSQYFRDRPNELLCWAGIEYGCHEGYRELDYCRSRQGSGTAAFKRKLRFTEEPLGYQYYVPNGSSVPEHTPANPKYQMAIQAWQRIPLLLTRHLGPAIVRHLA